MHINPRRVLIIGDEDARVFTLSGYMTLRGFQVDRAESVEQARALFQHLHYGAVVTSMSGPAVNDFFRDVGGRPRVVRTVALLNDGTASHAAETLPDADVVLGTDVTVAQLARAVCGVSQV